MRRTGALMVVAVVGGFLPHAAAVICYPGSDGSVSTPTVSVLANPILDFLGTNKWHHARLTCMQTTPPHTHTHTSSPSPPASIPPFSTVHRLPLASQSQQCMIGRPRRESSGVTGGVATGS